MFKGKRKWVHCIKTCGMVFVGALLFVSNIQPNSFARPSSNEQKADKILIEKSKRRLSLMREGKVFKTYSIALGREPVGAKTEQGDGKTPEGKYIIDGRNPNSAFHLSLHISYPNAQDKTRAKNLGVSPGGEIMIHGLPNGMDWLGSLHDFIDWTQGCIALTNSEIEEVWKWAPDGTEVEIRS